MSVSGCVSNVCLFVYSEQASSSSRGGSMAQEGVPGRNARLHHLEVDVNQVRGRYPVSYTHLDVYKRQTDGWCVGRFLLLRSKRLPDDQEVNPNRLEVVKQDFYFKDRIKR